MVGVSSETSESETSDRQHHEILKAIGLLIVTTLITFIALLFLFPQKENGTLIKEDKLPPPDLSVRPYGISTEFVRDLQAARYEQAYQKLSEKAAERFTISDFRNRVSAWRKEHPEWLDKLVVARERIEGEKGTVEFTTGALPEESQPLWKAEFVLRDKQWKMIDLEGPPFDDQSGLPKSS